MNAFARSWALFKSTLAVLNADKALLWFPILATTATLAVSAVIFGGAAAILVTNPAAQAYLSQAAAAAEAGNATLPQMLFFFASLFFYYLVINFTANYFMTGLAGAALLRFAGQNPGFGDGIRIANSRLGAIFGYSVIAATVGVLLSALRGRSGDSGSALAGRLVASIGEFAWGVATFLVVPVIAAKGLSPFEAIKESAALLRRTWGEQLIGASGIGLIFFAIMLPLAFLAGLTIIVFGESGAVVITTIVVAAVLLALLAVVNSTLNAIYRAALYHYAADHAVAPAFNATLIESAFKPREGRI
jgi:hypothetical protein